LTTPRRDRKRKGSPEWIRLGEQLADRRADLSPDYEGHGGRAAFARDREVNLKLVQDIELNARENFTPRTLRDVIAPAYEVTYESIRRALEEGGGLEPAAAAGTLAAVPPAPLPAGDIDIMELIPVPDEVREAARPYAVKFHRLYIRAVARTCSEDPPGDQVFDPGTWEATSWDLFRRQFPDTMQRLGIIAGASASGARAPGQHGTAAGLTAEEAALDRGNSAGGAA
jgi:hypothetical protein